MVRASRGRGACDVAGDRGPFAGALLAAIVCEDGCVEAVACVEGPEGVEVMPLG